MPGFERGLPSKVKRFIADQIVALRRHTTYGVEHLAEIEGNPSFKAIEDTVQAMLTSKDALSAFAPDDLLATWEKR